MMIERYRNQIIVGDALELLRTLPDESIPMFLFSPPYNLGTSTGRFPKRYGTWSASKITNGYEAHDDAMDWQEYTKWQRDVLTECWRALAPNGAIFYQHKPRIQGGAVILPIQYASPDMTLRQIVIWSRGGGVNYSHRFYLPAHEWVCIYAKSRWQLASKSESAIGDVWHIPAEPNTWHPAPFPLALATRALETVMPPLVCDPFMGSGTTAKAAVKLGIDYIGFELSEQYAERAQKEIADVAAQPRLVPIEATQERMELGA